MQRPGFGISLVVSAAAVLAGGSAGASVVGPLGGSGISGEYAVFSDSPFSGIDFSSGYFHLETFEDGLLDTPGVSADVGGVTSVVFGPASHDSVDSDDGTVDGNGLAGDSYFSSAGIAGITFTFSAALLGSLPTHAGLVWTDGAGDTTFEAFDENGASLGVITANHANASFEGQTDDDRFYGAVNFGGISAVKISNGSSGIEVDHLQYGKAEEDEGEESPTPIPLPAGGLLLMSGLAGLSLARRRRPS